MNKLVKDLIELSHYYGSNKDYVIAGGGNTSCKDDKQMWVKASGTTLGDIKEDGFAVLDRKKLDLMSEKKYSSDSSKREEQVKTDLMAASIYPEKGLRPSVEASLHALLNYKFVIHTHPTIVNAFTCSKNSERDYQKLLGKDVLYIKYIDPGYVLYKKVESEVIAYRKEFGCDPAVIILQNHGIFVSADTPIKIKSIYKKIISVLEKKIGKKLAIKKLGTDPKIVKILPAIRMLLSEKGSKVKVARVKNSNLVEMFVKNSDSFKSVSLPFTPDNIVYCKAKPLYINEKGDSDKVITAFEKALTSFRKVNGFDPKIIAIPGIGLIGVEDNMKSVEIILDVFEDVLKIALYSKAFGGPKFMNKREIDFINNWEVENYRRKISTGGAAEGGIADKIAIVTGGAQGFGGGIVEVLFESGVNVVIADLNEKVGQEKADILNKKDGKNRVIFVKCDVSNEESVSDMIDQTVVAFGGLDIFISNAGVLRAGGLEEMNMNSFEFMTKINYSGYFICTKYASAVMKNQFYYKPDYYTDIIQINSKSGLKGSNKNFAYAGGKFGGIGLTQSFALELMPFNVKVNSICPGNFFDGPLWSDPKTGLFVQYLKAGKVKGAKTLNDVKKFYEKQVPAGRGCTVADVMVAVNYVIAQKYETGQAVPVTGGQNMLK